MYLLETESDAWVEVGPGPAPTPVVSPILSLGNQLIAPILGADGGFTAMASTDAVTWTAIPNLTEPGSTQGRGSPQPFYVGLATKTTVIVPIASQDGGTATILVGHIGN